MGIGFVIPETREHMAHEISAKLVKLWVFAETVLFSMVGAQVNLAVAWRAGVAGAAVIGLGLLACAIGVLLCLARSRLNAKERLFVVVAYSPKATVRQGLPNFLATTSCMATARPSRSMRWTSMTG